MHLLDCPIWVIPLLANGGVKTGDLLGLAGTNIEEGIYTIDIDTAAATLLHPFAFDPSEGDIAVSPNGTLYAAFSADFDELVTIDVISGVIDYIGSFGFDDVSALVFGPDGTLYGFDSGGEFLEIDTHSGQATALGDIGFTSGGGLTFSLDWTLYASGTSGFARLYTVDPETGESTLIGGLDDALEFGEIVNSTSLSFVGSLLFASGQFESGDPWEDPQNLFWSVDPVTGYATEVGPFSQFNGGMSGMAFYPGAGDGDRDGDVDADDVAFFEACFGALDEAGKSPYCAFLDSDKDGDLDCDDWEQFIPNWTEETEPPTFEPCDGPVPCEGDANGDGTVDPLDAGYIMARFGCAVNTGDAECDTADVNLDFVVDPLDAGYALARFGTCV